MAASTPSAPLQDMADQTPDPVASPDNLGGVEERVRNLGSSLTSSAGGGSTTTPSRPDKSSAREGGIVTGVSAAASSGMTSVSETASSAYNRAPDLGITSTANSAYNRAPDLGVGATISSVLGQEQQGSSTGQEGTGGDKSASRVNEGGGNSTEGSGVAQSKAGSDRREESLRQGPSNESRLGKSQQQVGTETEIPTSAGVGSTASPDQDNMRTIEKAGSEGKITKAHVPEDYEPQDSSTDNAGTGRGGETGSSPPPAAPRQKSGVEQSSQDEIRELEGERKRGLGEKIKDQIKGEMKILKGTVTGKDGTVEQGLAIKHGDHH